MNRLKNQVVPSKLAWINARGAMVGLVSGMLCASISMAAESDANAAMGQVLPVAVMGPPYPAQLSFDFLSDAELHDIHHQLVQSNPKGRCMGWLLRSSPSGLRPVGVLMHHTFKGGLLKLNGQLRPARSSGSEYGQEEALGSTTVDIDLNNLAPTANFFNDFLADRDAKSLIAFSQGVKKIGDQRCSFSLAKCRRYSGQFGLYWTPGQDRFKGRTEYPLVDLVIEDTCPATSKGLVEREWVARTTDFDDTLNALVKGIAFNKDFKEALNGK